MHAPLIPRLRCPDDRGALRLVADPRPDGGSEVTAGTLICAICGRPHPIERGIAILLPGSLAGEPGDVSGMTGAVGGVADDEAGVADDALRAMREQIAARDEETELYNELYDEVSCRFEIETYVSALGARAGESILDVGCGTGRITLRHASVAA